jgi:hypothetical protein
MDESKKPILIGVIVVCLVGAGGITWWTRGKKSQGINSIPADDITWVKCRKPGCEAEYDMSTREYYSTLEARQKENPAMLMMPTLICRECNDESLYRAEKCAKCGLVFEVGWKRGDFEDRCPKEGCGFSQIEADRKAAAGKG